MKTKEEKRKLLLPLVIIILLCALISGFLFICGSVYKVLDEQHQRIHFLEQYIDQKTKLRYNSLEAEKDKADIKKELDAIREECCEKTEKE